MVPKDVGSLKWFFKTLPLTDSLFRPVNAYIFFLSKMLFKDWSVEREKGGKSKIKKKNHRARHGSES